MLKELVLIRKVLWQARNADDAIVNPTDWEKAMDAIARLEEKALDED